MKVNHSWMDSHRNLFPVIGGTPHIYSQLRSILVKLKSPKNGQEAPSLLQVFNERVKWL
jgi:hypothetical protein